MTTPGTLRRVVVATTLGSFSFAALMGVLALLGSGDFGDGQARVLVTTLLVGASSIAVLCYLATSETRYQTVGVLGGFTVLLPLLTGLWLIWADPFGDDSEAMLKAFGVGVVLALTLAQASLLLGLAGSRERLRGLLWATLALAAVLAVVVSGVILGGDGGDGLWRFIGIVAILDVLGTVVVIALGVVARVVQPAAPESSAVQTDPAVPASTGSAGVSLPGPLAAALDVRAARSGRTRDDLVAEAVARYLAAEASQAVADEAPDQSGM